MTRPNSLAWPLSSIGMAFVLIGIAAVAFPLVSAMILSGALWLTGAALLTMAWKFRSVQAGRLRSSQPSVIRIIDN